MYNPSICIVSYVYFFDLLDYRMAPTEVPAESILPLRSLKVIDRAMQLPVVHDTFGGVAKYTESIRCIFLSICCSRSLS